MGRWDKPSSYNRASRILGPVKAAGVGLMIGGASEILYSVNGEWARYKAERAAQILADYGVSAVQTESFSSDILFGISLLSLGAYTFFVAKNLKKYF